MSDALASLRARIEAQRAKGLDTGIPFCPHKPTPPQQRFLELTTLEAFYGGAAGGGKSDALLMDMLRWVDRPGFHGLILRRTLPDLALPGAIMDRAKSWLVPHASVHWNEVAKVFRFPSGARLQFGFCETATDVYRYQGAEFHRIGVDELTQWAEQPYRYLMSRLRRNKGDDIPLAMRGAGNPGGIGHKWVKGRFVAPGAPDRPFVPALLTDNPHLNQEEYSATLERLDEVTRAQLRHGLWVDDTAGLVYSYDEARNTTQELPDLGEWYTVLSVDLGSSEVKPTTAFCITLWHPNHEKAYVVRAWAEAGLIPSTIAERCHQVLELYPNARIVMDVGALGSGYASEMRQRHRLNIEAAQKKDKLGNRKLLNGALEQGRVVLLAPECAMLIEELTSLLWAPGGLDNDKTQPNHCTDALLYGWRAAQSWLSDYRVIEPKLSEEAEWEKRDRLRYMQAKANPNAGW